MRKATMEVQPHIDPPSMSCIMISIGPQNPFEPTTIIHPKKQVKLAYLQGRWEVEAGRA
jgi:hypothetical protein